MPYRDRADHTNRDMESGGIPGIYRKSVREAEKIRRE